MPDPNAAPLNLIQLFQLANVLVSSEIQGNYLNMVIQSTQPGADDQDKAWVVIDGAGRPLAIKTFYNGKWRRIYNGMIGEIRGFSGDPGYNATGNFNTNGLGNVGGEYDGWHLCNGKDGTPDLSNRFLVGAEMSPAPHGYSDGKWKTKIDDKIYDTGGQWTEVLKPENIPVPAMPAVRFRHWYADGNIPQPHTGNLWGVPASPPNHTDNDDLVAKVDGNASPVGVFIGPPFYSLAWIIFVGYQS